MASDEMRVGHRMGPFSMILPQLFLILAKCFLNSMPQPLERRKSSRIRLSTWINVQRNDKMAPLRSWVSIRNWKRWEKYNIKEDSKHYYLLKKKLSQRNIEVSGITIYLSNNVWDYFHKYWLFFSKIISWMYFLILTNWYFYSVYAGIPDR